MSVGLIASRYAKALLKLVDGTGNGELVVQQVQALQDALGSVPELRRAVDDLQAVTTDQKIALFDTVLSGCGTSSGTMAPELRSFITLLGKKWPYRRNPAHFQQLHLRVLQIKGYCTRPSGIPF